MTAGGPVGGMATGGSADGTGGNRAVVIGAGLGGLAAAMRLGAKGWRVTVIDRLDAPGGRGSAIVRDGHRFDVGPTIVTIPQLLRDLWRTCGRDFDAEIDLRALDPFYEIRFGDGTRFAARADPAAMRDEVARMAPADLAGWDDLMRGSAARYGIGFQDVGRRPMHRFKDLLAVLPAFARLRADRSVHAHVARHVRDERLKMAASFHPLFIGGDPFRVTSMYVLVGHLEAAFGVHYAMGGVAAIARAMAGIVAGQGGTLRLGTTVDEVVVERGRATGVRLESGEMVPADIVVSNADVGYTYRHMLRGHRRRRWTDRRLARARWSMGLYVWYFGTRGTRAMWRDVGHHTILSAPRYAGICRDVFRRGHLTNDMSVYIHRPSVTDPSVAPEGDDTFYALVPVPHLGHADAVDWQAQAGPFRTRLLQHLEATLLPGLARHLGPEEVFTPETFADRYLSTHGSGFSVEPRITQSAWFRPHNVSEEVPGLYLVGAGTHPGAGVPGVLIGAEILERLVPEPAPVAELPMAAE